MSNYLSINNQLVQVGTKSIIEFGLENQIRNYVSHKKFIPQLKEVISTIWEHYCGANPELLTVEFETEVIDLITNKFGSLGINEIKEAFRLASINIIHSDLRSFNGRISTQTIGNTLQAYSEYRKPVVAELKRIALEKERLEMNEADKKKKEEYMLHVRDWYENVSPKSWRDCPFYFLDTLVGEKLIEVNVDLRVNCLFMAINYRRNELELKKKQSNTLDDIRNASRELMAFNQDEKAIVSNYAKSMYLYFTKKEK